MNSSPPLSDPAWTDRALRRFRWMLVGVCILFLITEGLARTGLIPHLLPLSLAEVGNNILFAIGFGSPLLLYLSSLPGWRGLLGTGLTGAVLTLVLWGVQQQVSDNPWSDPEKALIAKAIVGLGLASLGAMALQAWRGQGEQRHLALLYLLPACSALVFTLLAGTFYEFISKSFPLTDDRLVYAVEEAHGAQFSFLTGQLFTAMPGLAFLCTALYLAPPPGLVFVYTLQLRARVPPPIDVVTALLVLSLTGYSMYLLCPVCGPKPVFGEAFPDHPPPVGEVLASNQPVGTAPRNAMPSLHMASVVLAYWHARPHGRWAQLAALVFLVGTFLATMGLGEHYLVDLIVAMPFTLALHALCTPIRHPSRWQAVGVSLLLVVGWYLLLFFGTELLLRSLWLTWTISGTTTGLVLWLEWRLYRSIYPRAEATPAS